MTGHAHRYLAPGFWAERAVYAWVIDHPQAPAPRLWAIVPGNTLSGKDPRPDVHSLHTADGHCGFQQAQGSLAHCLAQWPELLAALRANGCKVAQVRGPTLEL